MTWHVHAACAGRDVSMFFDLESAASIAKARAVCRSCPCVVPCLREAIALGEDGIRGGLTPSERARKHRRPVIHLERVS